MDAVRLGFIGLGNRGSQLLERFLVEPDADIVAFSDVYQPYMERDRSLVEPRILDSGKVIPPMGESFPHKVDCYPDFRDLLDRTDIDAVVIATPDHWHAVQTIAAFRSGKDVFVEKPLTNTIREGRRMIEVERETGRIGAVCLNRRGASIYRELSEAVPAGLIGKVVSAYAAHTSDMYPVGIGREKATNPPEGFDWDMWLGPRAYRRYQYNIAPYYFRWWSEYSSQMGNWGVHYMDVIRWLTRELAPSAVTAIGGRYVVDDDRDIPDTMTSIFEFSSGMQVQFQIHEACQASTIDRGEVELRGTNGTLVCSQDGYRVTPASPGQFQTWTNLTEPVEKNIDGNAAFGDLDIKEDSTAILVRNFLDCVKTREKPYATLEDAHRSTTFAHLANIALKVGGRIEWDSEAEVITNHPSANTMLHYEYREPWSID
jgi:predicted dehydrogenase